VKSFERSGLRERLAFVQHQIWAHWMNYLFSVSVQNPDGSITIPFEKVERWKRQASVAYDSLSNEEKESDKEQADKILFLLDEFEHFHEK
jgi:hypothetical protein